jgi:hypothetical protein
VAVATKVNFQEIVDKYAGTLRVPRLLYDLYPSPRPVGRPSNRYLPLPAATTLAVLGAFEGFAEDLLAAAMIEQGRTWAHVAKNADLTNPSLKTLAEKFLSATGIDVTPPSSWTTPLPRQTSATGWGDRPASWNEMLTRSEGWIQVRHCLSHGLVTGLGSEVWPPPISVRSVANQAALPSASDTDVLAWIRGHPDKRALYFWPSVGCARIYSVGASVIASVVAAEFSEAVDVGKLLLFEDV